MMVTDKITNTLWEEFIKRYHGDDLLAMAARYPESKSLVVDILNIEKFNTNMAEQVISDPDTQLEIATSALRDIEIPFDVTLSQANLRISGIQSTKLIRDIRTDDITMLIAIDGMVSKATEVRPKLTIAAFECQKCGYITELPQNSGKFVTPFECENEQCGRQGPFKLLEKQSTFTNGQKLRLQESPESLRGGEQPQTIDVEVTDDITGQVSPGDRIKCTGTLRSHQRTVNNVKSTYFDIILETNYIERDEQAFDDIEITAEDIVAIQKLSKQPDIIEQIVASIAPSIFGYKKIKESLALQLFSGIPKSLPDGTRVRGDIHMLLVGDPGIAKSQLLRYAIRLSPRGIYTSGKGTTAAGLTATAVKDEFGGGRWTLEAGALVMADKGMAAVDEMDKMAKEDRSALHEAMEQQNVTVAKAGILATLKSRCALLGAANPKFGRFDTYESIAQQINMPPALISRFDLIFILADKTDKVKDDQIARHIIQGHFAGEIETQYSNVTEPDYTPAQIEEAMEIIQPVIDPTMLRKYIAYAKRKIFPAMNGEAKERIIKFYMDLRSLGVEEQNSPIPVTARQLEALIRLAEASARLRLSNVATLADVERIINIVQISIAQTMTDPNTGKIDSDMISTGTSKSQRDRAKMIRNIILSISADGDGKASKVDIIDQAAIVGIEEDDVMKFMKQMKREGTIFEPTNGYLKAT